MKTSTIARRIFLRFILNNLGILFLPLVVAIVFYGISIGVIRTGIDSITTGQVKQSLQRLDQEFLELDKLLVQLSNDYEVNFYLSNDGPFNNIEYYNLRRISEKLSPYVYGNPIISQIILYLHRSNLAVTETDFGTYEDVYGTVFKVENIDSNTWKSLYLLGNEDIRFVPSQQYTLAGNEMTAHLYRRSIGYGDFELGVMVVVIDDEQLKSYLADIPQGYGGWVYLVDNENALITSTDDLIAQAIKPEDMNLFSESFEYEDERYRSYSMTSSFTGWTVTAALNETKILEQPRNVRDAAILLFGSSLLIGIIASYLIAFRYTKPWRKFFSAVQPDLLGTHRGNIYAELEDALTVITNRNQRLSAEVSNAEKITRGFFFQNLLGGFYQGREMFENEREKFGIEFHSSSYYVIVCRLAAIAAVQTNVNFSQLREALVTSLDSVLSPGDFQVSMSFDDYAIVREIHPSASIRSDAMKLIETLRKRLSEQHRDSFTFGVGTRPVEPFILTISYNQAVSAGIQNDAFSYDFIRFYENINRSDDHYSYPLDAEENLMRAIRSANIELVSELLTEIGTNNFEHKKLPQEEYEHLFVELQGTVLRLINAVPQIDIETKRLFDTWRALPVGMNKLQKLESFCQTLSACFEGNKKSHNSALLSAIQGFLKTNYANPNLSLAELSSELNRSENYLSNFYKDQTGERLSDELLKIRMDHAVTLLLGSIDPIDIIAAHCGYSNTGSFRRAFKRIYGISPSDYRSKFTK